MKRLIILLILLLLSSSFVFAQTAPDRDGDGIPDDADRCISQVGSRANHGCPERNNAAPTTTNQAPQNNPDDNDGDGTNNSVDACPDSGGPDWNAGCPETDSAVTPLSLP